MCYLIWSPVGGTGIVPDTHPLYPAPPPPISSTHSLIYMEDNDLRIIDFSQHESAHVMCYLISPWVRGSPFDIFARLAAAAAPPPPMESTKDSTKDNTNTAAIIMSGARIADGYLLTRCAFVLQIGDRSSVASVCLR